MHRPQTSKFVALFLSLCLLITYIPFSASAAIAPITPVEPPDTPTLPNGVSWSHSSVITTVTLAIGLGETKTFAQLGLSPIACYNGQYSSAFTWSEWSDAISINSNGAIVAEAEGLAMIYGTCRSLASGLGQLLLILFVVDSGYVNASLVDAIDDRYFDLFMYELGGILTNDFNYAASSIRMHPEGSATPIQPSVFMGYIVSSKIMIFAGHGEINRIKLGVDSTHTYYLTNDDLGNLQPDAFSYCELMLLCACKTASGGEDGNNFVNALLEHGVETVVGFQESVHSVEVAEWTKSFFIALAAGQTVEDARDTAWTFIEDNEPYLDIPADQFGRTNSCCIVGNKNKTF